MRVGLVGYGGWGRNWARVLDRMNVLDWVCDLSIGLCMDAVTTYPHVTTGTSLETLVHDYTPDAVVIATPPRTHVEVYHRVAGIDEIRGIMVEKPLALEFEDAEYMVNYAKKHSVTLSVDHTFTHMCLWQQTLTTLRRYGRPTHFRARWNQPLDAMPASARRAGLLWDLAPHPLSLALWLAPPGPPDSVHADTSETRLGFGLHWKNEYSAYVLVDTDVTRKDRRYSIDTEDGVISCDAVTGHFSHSRDSGHEEWWNVHEREEPLNVAASTWLDRVRSGEPGNGADGLRVVEILSIVEEVLK